MLLLPKTLSTFLLNQQPSAQMPWKEDEDGSTLEKVRRVWKKCAVQGSEGSKSSFVGNFSFSSTFLLPPTSFPSCPQLTQAHVIQLRNLPCHCHLMVIAKLSFPPYSYYYRDNLNTHKNNLPITLNITFFNLYSANDRCLISLNNHNHFTTGPLCF